MMIRTVIGGIFRIVEIAIIIECLASWIPELRDNSFMDIVRSITNPILEPCRQLQYKLNLNLPIDISPIIAICLLDVVRTLLYWIL